MLKCHAVETEFSQYCGHASAAGLLRVLKFCENRPISVTECKDAFKEKGKITVGRQQYRASLDDMTSHSDYITGNLDDGHNCEVGVHDFGGKKIGTACWASLRRRWNNSTRPFCPQGGRLWWARSGC